MNDFQTLARRVRETADLIESSGWFREVFDSASGRHVIESHPKPGSTMCHCFITAIPEIEMHLIPYYFAVFMGHDLTFNDSSDFLVNWNDEQTDPEVVVAKIREFADWLDSKETVSV